MGTVLPDEPAPDLSEYADGLAALNKAQVSDLDKNQRKLAALQWTLYARWWKNQNYNVLGLGPINPPDNMNQIAAALEEASAEYQGLVSEIKKLQQAIASAFTTGSVPRFTDALAVREHAPAITPSISWARIRS